MRVEFYTLGCKVNQYETQALKEEFIANGFRVTGPGVDLCVINTCTVTHRADTKSRDVILKARRQNPHAKIAAIGCLAQLNRDFLKALGVDCIVGQEDKHNLIDIILDRMPHNRKTIWSLKISNYPHQRAFVKIQDGCNNFCAYCKIPYLRGEATSRSVRDILDEVKRLSEKHYEIVLCGINIGLYGREGDGGKDTLASLVKKIFSIDTIGRIRLGSLDPCCIDDELLDLFRSKRLCPHLHLSFQSGDDKVLKLMNKKGTREIYRMVVNKIRSLNKLFAVSCDIITGFPGEDEDSFNSTVDFLEGMRPMRMHIFRFSPRERTCFSGLKVKNTAAVKKRYALLNDLSREFAYEYKKKFLGRTVTMVCEEQKKGVIYGYTENYLRACIPDSALLGEAVAIRINRVDQDKVYGRLIR